MAAQYLAAQGIDLDAEMEKVQFGAAGTIANGSPMHTAPLTMRPFQRIDRVLNASLPGTSRGTLWDVSILGGRVQSTSPHDPTRLGALRDDPTAINANGALMAPALCHPHIHLDKPYLLSHPKHSHLQIQNGDFAEAMKLTNEAKRNFAHDDLIDRGQRVIDESVTAGVTAMRAFVEVDPIVGMRCLDAGRELKKQAIDKCEIQLCAFAQLALFSTHSDDGKEMRGLIELAAERSDVDVVGSTPYVELSRDMMQKNVEWTIDLALHHNKHVDFHLDYNLDPNIEPLIWFVISTLKAKSWTAKTSRSIVVGHCTRLCLFTPSEWTRLKFEIADLPISFVGLPTSDLFMMRTDNQVRGTLPIPTLIKEYNLNCAIGVNNVGNAFTPQGCCDPLSVSSMCVGVYQAGTTRDVELLYECVSTRARAAIGLALEDKIASAVQGKPDTPSPAGSENVTVPQIMNEGRVENENSFGAEVASTKVADLVVFGTESLDWRKRKTISDAVYLYDGGRGRHVIKGGVLVDRNQKAVSEGP